MHNTRSSTYKIKHFHFETWVCIPICCCWQSLKRENTHNHTHLIHNSKSSMRHRTKHSYFERQVRVLCSFRNRGRHKTLLVCISIDVCLSYLLVSMDHVSVSISLPVLYPYLFISLYLFPSLSLCPPPLLLQSHSPTIRAKIINYSILKTINPVRFCVSDG